MEHMENDERYIVEYDTQTGEPIYSDGSRGSRPGAGNSEKKDSGNGDWAEVYRAETRKPEPEPVRPEPQTASYEEPKPLPEGNIYRYQNVEAVRPKKKKEKKGWTMPKIAIGAAMFGVIAAGCFFGVNAGLNALTGSNESKPTEQIEQTKVEAHTDNSKVVTSGTTDVSGIVEGVMPSVVGIVETTTAQNFFGQQYEAQGAGSGEAGW